MNINTPTEKTRDPAGGSQTLVAVRVSDLLNLIEELHKLPAPYQKRIFDLPFRFARLAPAPTDDQEEVERAGTLNLRDPMWLRDAMEGCPVAPIPMLLQHVRPILRRETRAHEIYGF